MRTALISDLHIGSGSASDVVRRPEITARLVAELADTDRLVLLGDTIELRDGPIEAAMEASRPFFAAIGEAMSGGEIVLIPGNHDHRLLGHWLERVRGGDLEPQLDELVSAPHPYVGMLRQWLGGTKLTLRYPGIWIRDDVYAHHGHYADSHLTLPTVERLSIASVDRLGGRPTGVRQAPEDYEKVHAPVYDLLFDLAQGARNPQAHNAEDGSPSMRVWEMVGGASGRARNWRGRLLRSAVIPATLRGAERAGLGNFSNDFSLGEIGRAGASAMHSVVERLEIDAEHVIFGHFHRRGPLPGEESGSGDHPEWERAGVQLHNTGCWIYVRAMLGRSSADSPFWPGRMTFVDETGPPRAVEVLADASHDELSEPVA